MGGVADPLVVGAEDRRAVEAAVRLAGDHDPLSGSERRQGVVEEGDRVAVPLEQGREQVVGLPGVGEEPLGVVAVAPEAGADVDPGGRLPGDPGVVEKAALVEALDEGGAVGGVVGAAHHQGRSLAAGKQLQGALVRLENLFEAGFHRHPV